MQCQASLDAMSLQNKHCELQLELTTRKLESLTDEYKKRIDEHALLKVEQATQQQQLMGALTLQLDDTRHKRDLSESSLRVLDEQLKSKRKEARKRTLRSSPWILWRAGRRLGRPARGGLLGCLRFCCGRCREGFERTSWQWGCPSARRMMRRGAGRTASGAIRRRFPESPRRRAR